MTIFESKVTINRPVHEVYSFLTDLNNHRLLMPDNVQDWSSTFDTASFSIKNMAKLSLVVESRVEDCEIKIIPSEKPPFDLELRWTLLPGGGHSEVTFTISADLNMMLKMLASGPLQKLAEHETQTLVSIIMLNTKND
jgi:carbon monoxide dehydrogenase subunit G